MVARVIRRNNLTLKNLYHPRGCVCVLYQQFHFLNIPFYFSLFCRKCTTFSCPLLHFFLKPVSGYFLSWSCTNASCHLLASLVPQSRLLDIAGGVTQTSQMGLGAFTHFATTLLPEAHGSTFTRLCSRLHNSMNYICVTLSLAWSKPAKHLSTYCCPQKGKRRGPQNHMLGPLG